MHYTSALRSGKMLFREDNYVHAECGSFRRETLPLWQILLFLSNYFSNPSRAPSQKVQVAAPLALA